MELKKKNKQHVDAGYEQKVAKKVRHPLLKNVTSQKIKQGIIYSEILGKPKGW